MGQLVGLGLEKFGDGHVKILDLALRAEMVAAARTRIVVGSLAATTEGVVLAETIEHHSEGVATARILEEHNLESSEVDYAHVVGM